VALGQSAEILEKTLTMRADEVYNKILSKIAQEYTSTLCIEGNLLGVGIENRTCITSRQNLFLRNINEEVGCNINQLQFCNHKIIR